VTSTKRKPSAFTFGPVSGLNSALNRTSVRRESGYAYRFWILGQGTGLGSNIHVEAVKLVGPICVSGNSGLHAVVAETSYLPHGGRFLGGILERIQCPHNGIRYGPEHAAKIQIKQLWGPENFDVDSPCILSSKTNSKTQKLAHRRGSGLPWPDDSATVAAIVISRLSLISIQTHSFGALWYEVRAPIASSESLDLTTNAGVRWSLEGSQRPLVNKLRIRIEPAHLAVILHVHR
jgi:hypothetical protein